MSRQQSCNALLTLAALLACGCGHGHIDSHGDAASRDVPSDASSLANDASAILRDAADGTSPALDAASDARSADSGVSTPSEDASARTDAGPAGADGGTKLDASAPRDARSDDDVPAAGDGGSSTSSTRWTAHRLGEANAAPNGYWEYLPPNYANQSAAPLIVFWHGVGSSGDGAADLRNVESDGIPLLINTDHWPDSRPFIVLAPQNMAKGSGDIVPGEGCPSGASIDAFITWALGHYKVDPKRVYLTGLSCGAIGSWDYLAQKRGAVVAAALLVCGNPGDPNQAGSVWARAGGCALANDVAIWSLHGDADDIVPFAPDRDTMNKLVACPNPPRRATRFTPLLGESHGIWASIYDLSGGSGDVYQWLLNNAKP